MKKSERYGLNIIEGEDNVDYKALNENTEKIEAELSHTVQGEGLTFSVDNDGILNVTYDDGTEEGEEGTENEADNQSSRQGNAG